MSESVQLAIIALVSSIFMGTIVAYVGYRLSVGSRKSEATVTAEATRLQAHVRAEENAQGELSKVRDEYLREIQTLREDVKKLRERLDQKDREIDTLQDENRTLQFSVREMKMRLSRYEKDHE